MFQASDKAVFQREAYILNKTVQEAKNEKLFGGRPKHFQTIIDSGQAKTYRSLTLETWRKRL